MNPTGDLAENAKGGRSSFAISLIALILSGAITLVELFEYLRGPNIDIVLPDVVLLFSDVCSSEPHPLSVLADITYLNTGSARSSDVVVDQSVDVSTDNSGRLAVLKGLYAGSWSRNDLEGAPGAEHAVAPREEGRLALGCDTPTATVVLPGISVATNFNTNTRMLIKGGTADSRTQVFEFYPSQAYIDAFASGHPIESGRLSFQGFTSGLASAKRLRLTFRVEAASGEKASKSCEVRLFPQLQSGIAARGWELTTCWPVGNPRRPRGRPSGISRS